MSVLNRKDPEYSKYDNMSTEALDEILRQDFLLSDDDNSDVNAILYISQIIVERENANPTDRFDGIDVDAAWERFKQNHLFSDSNVIDEDTQTCPKAPISAPHKSKRIRALRIALIAAVLTILFVTAAYAVTVLGWLPIWTDEHFTFAQTEETSNAVASLSYKDIEQSFDSMTDALAAHNAPSNIIPTRIPDGYKEIEFDYTFVPNAYTSLSSIYYNGENYIKFKYTIYSSPNGNGVLPKENSEPELYIADGISHYIFGNIDSYTAIWQNGDFECVFSGFPTREDLIDTITSMY